MAAQYSNIVKLGHCKQIARDNGHFVVEKPIVDTSGHRVSTEYLLYRQALPKNVFVGKRQGINDLLSLIKKATGYK
jgi:hypothetical protein